VREALTEVPSGSRVRVLFQDESRFGCISDLRRCWAPVHMRPQVGHQVIREYVYTLGAVCPQDGALVSLVMPWVDAEVMSIFLTHTAAAFSTDFCLMFLDGAGWHRADELRVPDSMKLMALPPYSPELNPVEQVWKHLRQNHFANAVFDTLDDVERVLCRGLRTLAGQPHLVRSMTNFRWLNALCLMYN